MILLTKLASSVLDRAQELVCGANTRPPPSSSPLTLSSSFIRSLSLLNSYVKRVLKYCHVCSAVSDDAHRTLRIVQLRAALSPWA